jgi:hypothetical protein
MKINLFLIILAGFNLDSFAMNAKGNPGCIRQNSNEIRAALFLIHLESGKLALELLDADTYENVGEEPLYTALAKAQKKYSLNIKPALEHVKLLKPKKTDPDMPPTSDLPD